MHVVFIQSWRLIVFPIQGSKTWSLIAWSQILTLNEMRDHFFLNVVAIRSSLILVWMTQRTAYLKKKKFRISGQKPTMKLWLDKIRLCVLRLKHKFVPTMEQGRTHAKEQSHDERCKNFMCCTGFRIDKFLNHIVCNHEHEDADVDLMPWSRRGRFSQNTILPSGFG